MYVPAVRVPQPDLRVWHPPPSEVWAEKRSSAVLSACLSRSVTPIHRIASAMLTQFPDPRLIQYDCGEFFSDNAEIQLIVVFFYREAADVEQVVEEVEERRPQGFDFHADDEDAGRFGGVFELHGAYISKIGRQYES